MTWAVATATTTNPPVAVAVALPRRQSLPCMLYSINSFKPHNNPLGQIPLPPSQAKQNEVQSGIRSSLDLICININQYDEEDGMES